MRLNLLLSLLLAAAGALPAQLTFLPDTIVVNGVQPTDFEKVGYATVRNAGADTLNIRWSKEIAQLSDGWLTAVCDRNFCHDPVVESEEVVVPSGDSTNMDVHVYPMGVSGSALVRVSVIDIDNPNDTLRAVYVFNGSVTAVHQPTSVAVRLYPNPTMTWFTLADAPAAAAQVEILTLMGTRISAWAYAEAQAYPVAALPVSTYLVQVRDRRGRVIGRQLLQKR